MSRERLAAAYDTLAEAYAQVAHELRATDTPRPSGVAAGAEVVPPPPSAPAQPLPPKRTAEDSAFTECPAHRKVWVDGRYGPFCPAHSDDPDWSNDKGYCRVTPRSAAAWLRKHPQGAAA